MSDTRGKVDKTRQVLEGEIQRRHQMKKDLETIRMWFVKIEVLINSKLAKHEEMDEREIKVLKKKTRKQTDRETGRQADRQTDRLQD